MTIAAHFVELTVKYEELRSAIDEDKERALVLLATELGEDVKCRALPWCDRHFVPKRKVHRFCSKEHNDEARNKSR